MWFLVFENNDIHTIMFVWPRNIFHFCWHICCIVFPFISCFNEIICVLVLFNCCRWTHWISNTLWHRVITDETSVSKKNRFIRFYGNFGTDPALHIIIKCISFKRPLNDLDPFLPVFFFERENRNHNSR